MAKSEYSRAVDSELVEAATSGESVMERSIDHADASAAKQEVDLSFGTVRRVLIDYLVR